MPWTALARADEARGLRLHVSSTINSDGNKGRLALSGNIEIIARFEHAFRAGDQAAIDELCDPGLADHNAPPGTEPTLAGFKQKVADLLARPDLKSEWLPRQSSSD